MAQVINLFYKADWLKIKNRGMFIMKNKLLGAVSAVLFLIVASVTSTATFFILYQPKTPKSFLK